MAKTTTVREAIASFEKSKGVVAGDETKVSCCCTQNNQYSGSGALCTA